MADPLTSLSAALADHYRIISELGHGGMASVYLAEDLKHHRRVAVKVLVPELAAALGPERFLREIEIAARLDHPHILPLYDSGEAGGFLYYVMPFVEGGTLRDRLQAERQLPIEDALQIAREVADALSYAHSRNVVHRDIKPENILLAGGHARVADFGIARAISAAGGNRLTQTGVAIGTVPYMSPEQAAGSVDLDGRSDLYSLGCVLYEMLAGDVPFVGPPESIIHQHLIADPPPITSRRPAVPPTVAAAIMRALAKTPADRFSPAAQFADALRPVERTAAAPPAAEPRSHLTTSPLSAGGAFAGISALVLAVVYLLVLQAGLPMWVFGGAVALLLIGLPIIVAAAVGERRRLTGAAPGFLTWRRALLGGGLAFSALAVVTLGYVLSRALGIGPAASLISKGTMASRQRVILADFDNRTSDSSRGPTVTELMRVGLSRSTVISLVDPDQVGRILDMMQRSLAQGLPGPVALEAAARDGIKGVITGEIAPVGSGLSITAQLLAQDGTVLLAESENIKDPNDLVAGVDRLSGRIREKFGESLRNIRANQPLDRVTTGSMKALRAFSLGLQAINQGDATRGMRLMDEAIADDSSFAMAYRKLAVSLRNAGEQRARSIWAAQQAYEHRDHLTDRERYLVVAAYHMIVTGDRDEQIANYRNVLDRYPDDVYSLTNMGVIYSELRDFARAAEYATRAIDVDSTQPESFENLVEALGRRSQFDSAQKVAERFQHRFPTNPDVKLSFLINEAMRRDYDSAAVLVDGLMKDQRGTVYWEALAYEWWGHLDLLRGQVAAARQEFKEAFRLTSKRGLEGTYLERTARRAMSERLLLDDPGVGQQLIDDALRQYPLANVRPLDRPYGILAMAMAASGQVAHAKSLMAEYQRTPDADHGQVAERWAHGARGVIALDEAKPDSAIAEFRRFDDGNACATCAWPWLAIAYDRTGVPDSVIALYERFVNLPSADVWYDDAHLAQAYERLGELYEQRGEPAKAAESYGRLLKLLHSADAVLQARVQEAEKAMARLAREGQTRG
jgi:tetratricopeptide (TPR) repeat protein/tRNA A-37 threonylcarbamoyl transferase component Bud32